MERLTPKKAEKIIDSYGKKFVKKYKDIYKESPNIQLIEALKDIIRCHTDKILQEQERYNLPKKTLLFDIVKIKLKVNKKIKLKGLDSKYIDIDASSFAICDKNNKNIYYLIDSVNLKEGTHELYFRSSKYKKNKIDVNKLTKLLEENDKISIERF